MGLLSIENGKLKSLNPATLETVGAFDIDTPSDIAKKISLAKNAFPEWHDLPVSKRVQTMIRLRNLIAKHSDAIMDAVWKDTGKPHFESLTAEVAPPLYYLTYYARKASQQLKPKPIPFGLLKNKEGYLVPSPYGVVAVISPWNYPFYLSLVSLMLAVLAGNVVIYKPSEYALMTGIKIKELFDAAGFPEGVFQLVLGDGKQGGALVDGNVDMVTFTGSVGTGRKIMEACSKKPIPCVLELGGKDAMIVLDDAPFERATNGAVWGAFANCGQICASVERVYVAEKIAEPFLDSVVKKTKTIRVGSDPKNTDMGPLISQRQLSIVESHVQDAVAKKATVLTGGKKPDNLKGYFYEPTILTDVNHGMRIMTEETFGPVMPVMRVGSVEEALELANASEYGLTFSVWTKNKKKAWELARKLHAGTVTINDHLSPAVAPEAPWGGVKQSGIGKTRGEMGVLDFTYEKHVNFDRFKMKRELFWYPYNEKLSRTMAKLLVKIFGRGA